MSLIGKASADAQAKVAQAKKRKTGRLACEDGVACQVLDEQAIQEEAIELSIDKETAVRRLSKRCHRCIGALKDLSVRYRVYMKSLRSEDIKDYVSRVKFVAAENLEARIITVTETWEKYVKNHLSRPLVPCNTIEGRGRWRRAPRCLKNTCRAKQTEVQEFWGNALLLNKEIRSMLREMEIQS